MLVSGDFSGSSVGLLSEEEVGFLSSFSRLSVGSVTTSFSVNEAVLSVVETLGSSVKFSSCFSSENSPTEEELISVSCGRSFICEHPTSNTINRTSRMGKMCFLINSRSFAFLPTLYGVFLTPTKVRIYEGKLKS